MKVLVWLRFMIHLSIQLSSKMGSDLEKEEFVNSLVYQRSHLTSLYTTPIPFPTLYTEMKNILKPLKNN